MRQCLFSIEYYEDVRGLMVKEYRYFLTVHILRTSPLSFIAVANPILEVGRDVQTITGVMYDVIMYRGNDCRNEITMGSSLRYGEDVCISIIGGNPLTRSFYFKLGTLIATYSRVGRNDQTIDMKSMVTIRHSLENVYKSGEIYIILPIINIGRLNFVCMIFLNEERHLLQVGGSELLKAIEPKLPSDYLVEDPYGRFNEMEVVIDSDTDTDRDINSACWVLLPLVTLLNAIGLMI